MRILSTKVFIAALMFFAVIDAFAEEQHPGKPFDYSTATNIIVYTNDGERAIWFPKPMEVAHSRGPAILYRDILSAMSESRPASTPSTGARYIIDIQSEANYKRLFVGEDWISDGQTITSYEGNNPVLNHIEARIRIGTLADYSTKLTELKYANLRADKETEGNKDEHAFSEEDEKASIIKAVENVRNIVEIDYQRSQADASDASLLDPPHDGEKGKDEKREPATINSSTDFALSSTPEIMLSEVNANAQSSRKANKTINDDLVPPANEDRSYFKWIFLIVVLIVAGLVGRKAFSRR